MNVRLPRGTVHATEDGHKTICGWPIPPDAPEEDEAALTCKHCRYVLRQAPHPKTICPECGGPKQKGGRVCRDCAYPNRQELVPMSGRAKAEFGCIVSFENADGKTWSVHRVGYIKQAVREACEAAVKLDETFRVIAISTPTSIHTDLQGARRASTRDSDEVRNSTSQLPEASLLGLAGVKGMLHPRYVR